MALLFPSSFHCTIPCYFRYELMLHLNTPKGISPPRPLSPPAEEVAEREASEKGPEILGARWDFELEGDAELLLAAGISTTPNQHEKPLPLQQNRTPKGKEGTWTPTGLDQATGLGSGQCEGEAASNPLCPRPSQTDASTEKPILRVL